MSSNVPLTPIHSFKTRLQEFALRHARGKRATWWLAAFSFAESSFFLVPPDVILLAMMIAGAGRFWYYAGVATIASVAGGAFAYLIGFGFFDVVGERIIDFYGLESEMNYVGKLFAENVFWAIFISAFTPIPYKVFTIAAGFFQVQFVPFIVASLFGRGLRFFAVAYLGDRYGKQLGDLIYRYFNTFSLLFVVVAVLLVVWKIFF